MRNKKRINTTFDNELWDLLNIAYGSRRVEILEELARAKLFGETSIEELEQQIDERETELEGMKDRLKELKRIRAMNDNNKALVNKAMATIRKILYNQRYVIGLNQIESVARINGLSFVVLKLETEKIEDIQITKIYEPPRN